VLVWFQVALALALALAPAPQSPCTGVPRLASLRLHLSLLYLESLMGNQVASLEFIGRSGVYCILDMRGFLEFSPHEWSHIWIVSFIFLLSASFSLTPSILLFAA
jgi:hypothetical protein